MDKQEVIGKIISEVQKVVMKKVLPHEPLLSSRLLDSMGVVDLTTSLEILFNINIDIRDITPQNFETIDNIANYIEKSLNG